MKKTLLLFATTFSFNFAFAQNYVPGNLVVFRHGTGDAALPTTANTVPVFLDEYSATSAGAKISTLALPTVVDDATGNRYISGSAINNGDGLLSLSPNGKYLVAFGYNAAPGAAYTNSGQRVIALVSADKTINTTTRVRANVNNPNHAVTNNDATSVWIAGSNNSLKYKVTGPIPLANEDTQLLTAPPAAISSLFIFNNQLYLATKEAGIPKIGTVGTGLPTTASQTITGLPGIPETAVPDQFVLFDSNPATPEPDVLYFTEGDLGNLQKYVFNGSAWESKGTVKVAGTTDEIRGLTGSMVDGNVVLYSTSETKLLKFTDQAAITSTLDATVNAPALLAEAAANTQFKGVAYTPGTNPNNPLAIGGMFYEQIGTLHIFPNPVQNQFALSLPEEATNQNLKVALITGSGQTLATFSGSLKTINQQLQTRVTGLKAGIFFLKVTGAKGAYSARFYKQ